MKCTIAVAVVAALIAVTCGAPVTSAVDWSAIIDKVAEIEAAIQGAFQRLTAIANSDNAAVGAEIERKLTVKAAEARPVLAAAHAAISSRSLTEEQARELLGKLVEILAAFREDIRPHVAKLSLVAQTQIRDILNTAFGGVENLANDIYALLRAAATFTIDWSAVESKANDIETDIKEAIQQIIAIAKRDNSDVGADIERKLLGKADEARAVLEAALDAIRSGSLTEQLAREIFGKLMEILAGVQEVIRTDVAKLSPGTQAQIRDVLNGAYSSVEKLANEIYALLRQQ